MFIKIISLYNISNPIGIIFVQLRLIRGIKGQTIYIRNVIK